MATRKRKMCGYVAQDTWHRFRVGCLQRQISASKQLESLVTRQVDAWAIEDLGQPLQDTEWHHMQSAPPDDGGC